MANRLLGPICQHWKLDLEKLRENTGLPKKEEARKAANPTETIDEELPFDLNDPTQTIGALVLYALELEKTVSVLQQRVLIAKRALSGEPVVWVTVGAGSSSARFRDRDEDEQDSDQDGAALDVDEE